MFMFSIMFNIDTSPYTEKDKTYNLMFLREVERHINSLFKRRGYMYLNTIYETLGVKWNTEWDNICRNYEEGARIKFDIDCISDQEMMIDIYW